MEVQEVAPHLNLEPHQQEEAVVAGSVDHRLERQQLLQDPHLLDHQCSNNKDLWEEPNNNLQLAVE